jgi:hypothetical protein
MIILNNAAPKNISAVLLLSLLDKQNAIIMPTASAE